MRQNSYFIRRFFALAILLVSYLFVYSQDYHKYFTDNISKLDPIEGEYYITIKGVAHDIFGKHQQSSSGNVVIIKR